MFSGIFESKCLAATADFLGQAAPPPKTKIDWPIAADTTTRRTALIEASLTCVPAVWLCQAILMRIAGWCRNLRNSEHLPPLGTLRPKLSQQPVDVDTCSSP